MFAERDKHYPGRSGPTSLATAVTNITKSVTKNDFGPITEISKKAWLFAKLQPGRARKRINTT